MALLIIFSLIGVGLGEVIFYQHGWLIGGIFGFLITKILQQGAQLNRLESEVRNLQVSPVKPPELQPVAPVESPVPAAPAVSTETTTSVATAQTTVSAVPSLEERLRAQGVELPEPQAPITPPLGASVQRPPRQPNAVEKAAEKFQSYLKNFFTQGNPIVRIGMVVMLFGLSFLVKYAANQGMFPLELRMAIVALIAFALIVVGWKTRAREGGYGLVLQGGGIAAIYLTLFAAAKMYAFMPAGVALVLMLLVVALGVLLAVLQNAQVLALMATAGGFLAPILTSDGSGNHIGLFSFYLLLNLGILAIAWFKTWRLLNWVGFVFTFVITSLWGVLKYEPQFYASTQPFLLAFFALYLCVSILFSLKQPPNLRGLVDGSLIFGLPIVGFGLQTALLKHTEYGLAISALLLAVIYIALARGLWAKYQQTHRVLIESFIALGVTFATLTIPLALDAQWTSATWALEAAGLIWVGLRQQRLLPRCAGYLLYIAAAMSLLVDGVSAGAQPIIRGDFIGILILILAAMAIAFLAYRFNALLLRGEKNLSQIAQIIGWLWWLHAGYMELMAHLPGEQQFAALISFFALSVIAVSWLSKTLAWPSFATLGFWLLPLTSLWALRNFGEGLFIGYNLHPSQGWALLALGLFFAVQYRFLWARRELSACGLLSVWHVLTAWFLFTLIYWEASYWQGVMQWQGTSSAVLWFVCLVVPLIALLNLTNKTIWPFAAYPADYKNLIPAPLLLLLFGWFLLACRSTGITTQMYLPLLNPLDLAQAAVVVIVAYAIKRDFVNLQSAPAQWRYGLLGGLGFVWINLVLLRAIHHYAQVDYTPTVMWNSAIVQMSLSILWAICALVVMNLSRRWQIRNLWLLGAALLGVIVAKLFLKDLSGAGTLAGVVSFMAVGALMLLIGYLSPIPAKAQPNDAQ
ncbi:DUF2339 domain-containing protein [Cellvibrio fontiphilus]|uniref:DUF2339 domain-containing protein n=1 Tax=Cellvibrio fontiphilus TaxID=1815559 RepID=A0ABV7FFK8_9GAMM